MKPLVLYSILFLLSVSTLWAQSEELSTNNEVVADSIAKEMEKPFIIVEQIPSYPGGDVQMKRDIQRNLCYPLDAWELRIEGTVEVAFKTNKHGKVFDVRIEKSLFPSCDKEAVRIVDSMPKWVPGKANGRSSEISYIIPVTFKLTSK